MHLRAREQQGARIAVVPPVRGGSCAAPRSGRARSKHRRRPQLCAKPPLQRLAARHPSASRLPSFRCHKSQLTTLARDQCGACARCGWHVGASGRIERLWTDPVWRSSPAGPGRSAAPATHGWHDHTFRSPSQPGGLMCASDEGEAQATSPGPPHAGRLVRASSRAARSVSWLGIPAQRLPARNAPRSSQTTLISTRSVQLERAPACPDRREWGEQRAGETGETGETGGYQSVRRGLTSCEATRRPSSAAK